MGANLDGIQAAVLLLLAVVGAGDNVAFDRLVGGAGAAVLGTIAHIDVPPSFTLGFAGHSLRGGPFFIRRLIPLASRWRENFLNALTLLKKCGIFII